MNETFEKYVKKILPKIDSEINDYKIYYTPRDDKIYEKINSYKRMSLFYEKNSEESFNNNKKAILNKTNITKSNEEIKQKVKIQNLSKLFNPSKIIKNYIESFTKIKDKEIAKENLDYILNNNIISLHKFKKLKPINTKTKTNKILFDLYHNKNLVKNKNFSFLSNKAKIGKENEKTSIEYLNKLESNQSIISPIKKLKGLKLMRQIKNNNSINNILNEQSSLDKTQSYKDFVNTNSVMNIHENKNMLNCLKIIPSNKINIWMLDYNKIAKLKANTNYNSYFYNYNKETFNTLWSSNLFHD